MSTITAPEIPTAELVNSGIESEITPEELLTIPDGKHFELVDGRVMERNSCGLSSHVAVRLSGELNRHVAIKSLGWVFSATAGYRCFPWKPKNIRRSNVSFIRADRITMNELTQPYITIPPDLVVEVISPGDYVTEINKKIDDYLIAGVRLIWIVCPKNRTVQTYRSDGSGNRLRETDELSGEDVIPEFRCPLGSLFPTKPITEPTPAAS